MKVNQEMRITDEELRLIKNTFAENDDLLKLLRKVFLPELNAKAPLGQQIDLYMTIPVDNMTMEQALVNLKARNTLINHVEMQLLMLKSLAGLKEETVSETKERLKKDSSK
jgi:hypothetical protein